MRRPTKQRLKHYKVSLGCAMATCTQKLTDGVVL